MLGKMSMPTSESWA